MPIRDHPALRRVARLLPARVRAVAVEAVGRRPEDQAEAAVVSIVVPIYNVEEYLGDCLTSLRKQSYEHLEILVVDDGSPDDSVVIAREHAVEDPRIKVVSQENGGLGAARNTGVRHARGRYLCFVDSDDVIPARSIAQMVSSAEKSGSDMVVGILSRFNATQEWKPAWADLHAESHIGIRTVDLPEIVRNNYSCGKLFRTSFWRGSGLWFREGVAYEDQPLITQLYVRATAVDVLPIVTYQWRQRADRSSISQQTHSLRDLRDRVEAWTISQRALSAEAPQEIYDAWLRTLYTTHFHWYLKSNSTADDDYWRELQSAVARLTEGARPNVVEGVMPQELVAIELTRQDLRQKLHDFKRAGGYTLRNFPTELTDHGLQFKLPTLDDPEAGVHPALYCLPDDQVPLVHRLEGCAWNPDGSLRVEGWAYFRYVDLAQADPDISVIMERRKTGERVEVRASYNREHGFFPPIEDKLASYEAGAFVAELPVATFVEERTLASGDDLVLRLRVRAGRLDRTALVANVHPGGSARFLPPRSADGGVVHRVENQGRLQPFTLRYLPHAVVVENLLLRGAELSGLLRSTSGDVVTGLTLDGSGKSSPHRFTVDPAAEGQFAVTLPPEMANRSSDGPASTWTMRAGLSSGEHAPVTCKSDSGFVLADEDGRPGAVSAFLSHRGIVTLSTGPHRVEVDKALLEGQDLSVSGRVPGASGYALTFSLTSERARSISSSAQVRGGEFTASVPLRHEYWRFGQLPLPTTVYSLSFTLTLADGSLTTGQAVVTNGMTQELPQSTEGDKVAAMLTRGPRRSLRVRVVPPLGWAARSLYDRTLLEERHQRHTGGEPLEGVLIETYFGEIAGCNGTAIQRELERRGAGIPVYWTVKDHSVAVPEGGIPVVRDSEEWFRALRSAKYLIDNMYQPPYHLKPEGQVIIATFHGYPFKVMGHPHWENLQLPPHRIASLDARAAEWDYLLSPARYATPLLSRDFAYDGEMLEIGYPRNDVLQSSEAPRIRAETRECLGIGEDRTVILYAPTFRDYLSADDFRAPMPDFLDGERLVRTLGDDYVLLMRGHAFNARTRTRPQTAHNIIDVTDYPEPADLYLASDAAVLDYSSLRFDYAVTGKPMLFLVPDLDRYKDTRGWLLDYEPTAPGPLLGTTQQVAEALQDLDSVVTDHKDAYTQFRRSYLDLEDGRAAARFVDAVFVPRGDAPPAHD